MALQIVKVRRSKWWHLAAIPVNDELTLCGYVHAGIAPMFASGRLRKQTCPRCRGIARTNGDPIPNRGGFAS